MDLLERQSPLAELARYAQEAREGQGRLVLLAGEAGVGKTALAEQLQQDLPGARWSWGACDGLFTPQPLGPLFDLASQLDGELAGLCRAGSARELLFAALLRQISEPARLDVVVVEDVHWADEATVDLLRFLGRRLRDRAVLLIVTYREEGLDPDHPLRLAVGDLAGIRSTRRVTLTPLSEDGVRQLARDSELDATELYRLTGGNPFFVTEVVQAGIPEVPAAARDAVLARAARLSPPARDLLDVAALTGTRIEQRLIGTLWASPAGAVDAVLASGLLREDGGWLRFRHEIARLAVEQALPAHRKSAIHTRILAALDALGAEDAARMAFHAAGAGDGGAVLRYATGAARRAASLASHQEAAAQFQRALRFTAGADPAAAAALYDGLATEAALIDRWRDVAEANEHALTLWREAGDPLRAGDTLRRQSRTMWRLCRGPESTAAAESALETLQPLGPSPELGRAYANLAAVRSRNDEHEVRSTWPGGPRRSPGRWSFRRCSATRSTPKAACWPAWARTGSARCRTPCGSPSRRVSRSRPGGRSRTLTRSTASSAGSPNPNGSSMRASRTARTMTFRPSRTACAAAARPSWNRPDAGTKPSYSAKSC